MKIDTNEKFKKNELNPWTPEDEQEHYPSVFEWWAVESFFKSVEDNRQWSAKGVFTEWFDSKNDNGSIFNLTLFDQDNDKTYTCHLRTDFKKLDTTKDKFDVKYKDCYIKGAYPKYEMSLIDKKNDIKLDIKYHAESLPRWIAQDATNGLLPMGSGFFKYGFIPKNKLIGTLHIKNKKFTIEGKGYLEHVWGDFFYDTPLSSITGLIKTFPIYCKLFFWLLENRKIKIPNTITLATENNPFGYDWSWALFDNGWTVFYGNFLFWLMEGPAMGTLILTKDGKNYTEFSNINFRYNKIQFSKTYDFVYPTELEITGIADMEKIHLKFKMTTEAREYISRFTKGKYWLGFVICEAPGIASGYYLNGDEKIKLNGVAKLEPQRQASIIGHNSLKIDFIKPPEGAGISIDLDLHYLKKRIFTKIQLALKPSFNIKVKRLGKLHNKK